MKIGLDVGSTTLKCVVYNEQGDIAFSAYERHFSQIAEKAGEMLAKIQNKFPSCFYCICMYELHARMLCMKEERS